MGKKTGIIALVLGVLLIGLAALSRFWAYDHFAVAPDDQETVTVSQTLEGADAQYLDVAAGMEVVEGPLQSVREVTGDPDLSEQASDELDRDVVVWKTTVCTAAPDFDCASGDAPLSGTRDVVAFDPHTAETVSWDGASSTVGDQVIENDFEGLYFKFPFDTQKETYDFWDGTVRAATPATYEGETEIEGMKVYEFKQVIEPVKVGTIDLPGQLLGVEAPMVSADRIYSNTRSFLVEPATGVIVRGGEEQESWIEVAGNRVITTTDATLQYTDETVKDQVDEYEGDARMLGIVQTALPLVALILGIVLLVIGAFALVRAGRATDPDHGGPRHT